MNVGTPEPIETELAALLGLLASAAIVDPMYKPEKKTIIMAGESNNMKQKVLIPPPPPPPPLLEIRRADDGVPPLRCIGRGLSCPFIIVCDGNSRAETKRTRFF